MAALLGLGKNLEPIRCGVVHPCDADSLRGAIEAAQQNLIVPILIGPESKIRSTAESEGIDLTGLQILAAATATKPLSWPHRWPATASSKA